MRSRSVYGKSQSHFKKSITAADHCFLYITPIKNHVKINQLGYAFGRF